MDNANTVYSQQPQRDGRDRGVAQDRKGSTKLVKSPGRRLAVRGTWHTL